MQFTLDLRAGSKSESRTEPVSGSRATPGAGAVAGAGRRGQTEDVEEFNVSCGIGSSMLMPSSRSSSLVMSNFIKAEGKTGTMRWSRKSFLSTDDTVSVIILIPVSLSDFGIFRLLFNENPMEISSAENYLGCTQTNKRERHKNRERDLNGSCLEICPCKGQVIPAMPERAELQAEASYKQDF
ncbi:hypothetical protein EVAR_87648_1 [Eumeta japonica]|uniref:Uncharacterized protein n=1 Tax=Eumeta variegata TaxID=151549 RepID=A0A4C1WIM7_EUMVA|nr:hypothetical protein EVAR_87648_1 [Eumeta japonica]